MAAHTRTLELDNSLFFAASRKVFKVQKSIIFHFETLSKIKLIEGYMALLMILGVIDRQMALLLQANMVTYQSHSMQSQTFCPTNWQ